MLLAMVREERWQEFIDLAERYIFMLNDIIDDIPEKLSAEEKDNLIVLIKKLLDNEQEIAERLEKRLLLLKEKMSSLQQGKQCGQFYSLQALSIQLGFH